MKIPVIIDCDPGHDDALMLMLAFGSGKFDVKAVTTSAGNQTQDKTMSNALKLLTLIGAKNVPVYRGAEKPLFRNLIIADYVHGETGLDGPALPAPAFEPENKSAVEGIAEILSVSTEKITIVPTGPLTNIATFLLAYPHLKDRIERISLMGGGIFRGNMTPLAEFNIFADPEAAHIVFKSGIPITMCGLDVTHKALVFQKDIELLRSIGNNTGKAAADLMDFFSIFYRENRTELDGGAALHDPCAIAWLIEPEMFKSKPCFVDVEINGMLTMGTTVVDFYNVTGKEPNAEVVYDIDRERYIEMLYEAIRTLP
ncbi:pyrimidine-specific ribonucleoside hydrolase RihA [Dyadobacter luteus]|jgi:pyrimidine-specific ribonucleoside hydrolase|uniref:Pyrimidine-specific ribonucleoside hydrolase RihA n=1 Tax=Dyadobacter luteus TaxID=2259619 RepID=A0A3D8Y4A9_9BACT|nr:pyrimidine-specific ribonucleoside hydrolase RihA [Dyadobacter luteus]REA57092.1 pyrimidine-specific ribonucleoside hydrolase RihA [Dyadobacter luteus]